MRKSLPTRLSAEMIGRTHKVERRYIRVHSRYQHTPGGLKLGPLGVERIER